MTNKPLTFECPQCGRFCAANEGLAGKAAQCNNCGCEFFIPQSQGQKPIRVKEREDKPLPGFYRAALIANWAGLFRIQSLTGLLFCAAMTTVQLIAGDTDFSFTMGRFRTPFFLGWVVQILTFGSLFWYFFQTVTAASTEQETLPDVEIGFGFEFFGNVVKSMFLFFNALLIAFLLAMVAGACLESYGINYPAVKLVLFVASCLLVPIELAILACGLPMWTVFRFDLITRAIAKTFRPYLLTVVITLTGFWCWFLTIGLFGTGPGITRLQIYFYVAVRVAAMIPMLFCLRVIGLYCRHYSRTEPRLWLKDI